MLISDHVESRLVVDAFRLWRADMMNNRLLRIFCQRCRELKKFAHYAPLTPKLDLALLMSKGALKYKTLKRREKAAAQIYEQVYRIPLILIERDEFKKNPPSKGC